LGRIYYLSTNFVYVKFNVGPDDTVSGSILTLKRRENLKPWIC
jgi:hypothetical protein